jgi:hypothetical protein
VDEASLRRQLKSISERTSAARNLPVSYAWWDGDVAGKRQVFDDFEAGRSAWRAALHSAEDGLKALDRGDLREAESFFVNAIWLYIDVLEKRVRPSDMSALGRPSKKRGRRPKKKSSRDFLPIK